jgi:hypothetical protein
MSAEVEIDTVHYSRFAECHVTLHLVNINLPNRFLCRLPVHVDVHNVLCDGLSGDFGS